MFAYNGELKHVKFIKWNMLLKITYAHMHGQNHKNIINLNREVACAILKWFVVLKKASRMQNVLSKNQLVSCNNNIVFLWDVLPIGNIFVILTLYVS